MTVSDQDLPSSTSRPQIVSSVTEDIAENPGKGDGALEEQALVGQKTLSGDQLIKEMTKYPVPKGSGDVVMIQSDTGDPGTVDALSTELESADLLGEQRKVSTPPLSPPSIWTFAKMKEFKTKMSKVKNSRLVVKRGEVVTVRVPTHPDGKRLFWEFATDNYDIGFGVYFDWTPVTSTAVTVHVSESSDEDEDDEEDGEGGIEGLVPIGDVEMGSKSSLRNRYGEIMPVYRRDSHRDVQAGCHDYPGEGIYLLKFDNSYSLLRNKTLYYHVYYTS
ncbi:protein TMED8 isoform X2 [Monodelphis domestica]|nr:protein TMED8 isoform X2 [Monodelphis domestica]XP_056666595.1 protein TMED8 isoform X2 [Monodelphis domestica]